MSERKVINKYYPPDFDPLKVQSSKKRKDKSKKVSQTVRLMTPFSIRCLPCGEYMAKSKKFNAKKEDTNERYLQQKIFRFRIRCPRCNGEIVFRTDPRTSDFVMESGGERNYNPVKHQDETKLESYDEILERLEKEEQVEKEELLNKDRLNKMTKIQALEEKLLEQEEEDRLNRELSSMTEKMKKQDSTIIQLKNDEEDDLDKMALAEFMKFRTLQQSNDTQRREGSLEAVLKEATPLKKEQKPEPIMATTSKEEKKGELVLGYDSSSEEEEEEEEVIRKVVVGKKRPFNSALGVGDVKRVKSVI